MVLGPAYRGHAPVTFDTVTAQAIIDEVNGISNHVNTVLPNTYAPSAKAYFLDVANGDGIGTVTAVPNIAWTKLNAAGTVNSNPGGGWDSGTDIYACPVAGIYFCQALVRLADGIGASFNLGLGIGDTEADGAHLQWNKYFTGAGGRCAFDYTRIAACTAGQGLRLYAFQDSGATQNVTRVGLQIFRIG